MKMIPYIIVILLTGVVCMLFFAGKAPSISASSLSEKIKKEQAPAIIDVRTAGEYHAGHIPGAQHLPFQNSYQIKEMDLPRSRSVVVYCAHGPRAWWAAYQFKRAGFENIYHLKGHMRGWRKAGLPESYAHVP